MNYKQETKNIISALIEFAKERNIDRPTTINVLDITFRTLVKHKFGQDDNFEIVINLDKGDMQIWRYREVVEDDSEDVKLLNKISLTEAKKVETDFELGEQVADEIPLEIFGRRAVSVAKQTLSSVMRGISANVMIEKYANRIGKLIVVKNLCSYSSEAIFKDEDGDELVMPKSHQMPKDRFRKDDYVKVVIYGIQSNRDKQRVIISRSAPEFLAALLENEIPELEDGTIQIKNIVREPGERAKVAVRSLNENVDPAGACIGSRGVRISSIVRELHNENIDIINYTESIDLYISRALSPAKVSSIKHLKNNKVAVYIRPDQVAKAIGTKGLNVKLATKLVGLEIDIYRELANSDYDILLDEFTDEIDPSIIDCLKQSGVSTAKELLAISQDEIKQKLSLTDKEVISLYKILSQEFN